MRISVDAGARAGTLSPVWSFFGYDEPNYTYTQNGRKLLKELAALTPAPVYIRTHNLLTSGDGTGSLKWGSTNAYTENAAGQPVYDWKTIDRIFDAYRDAGVRPLVEIGFMPEALSTRPLPYRHHFPAGPLFTGWSYPPRDYNKWAELIYKWVRHSVDRYGVEAVSSWYWEVWNEPNISYWHGSREEYLKLYDFTADAVKRAFPQARIAGPHSTGPSDERAAAFLTAFLEHCAHGANYATGGRGAPLDYIGFHAKGVARMADGHIQMGSSQHLANIARGFEVVRSFPEFRNLPVIIGESDPEGCAACSGAAYPQSAYRNSALYSAYIAAVFSRILELAEQHGTNLAGVVTWAFEFEDQSYFAPLRSLATNGIDKPVLNVFRMLGRMPRERIHATSTGASSLESMLESGVRGISDIGVLAARDNHRIDAMVWNYRDDDVPATATEVEVTFDHLPVSGHVEIHHYRVDEYHSNAYTVWQQMGSPQHLSAAQYKRLEHAGQLATLTSPHKLIVNSGTARVRFSMPVESVSLLEISW